MLSIYLRMGQACQYVNCKSIRRCVQVRKGQSVCTARNFYTVANNVSISQKISFHLCLILNIRSYLITVISIHICLVEPNNHVLATDENCSSLPSDNELVIREDGDIIESDIQTCSSKIHVKPAAPLHVQTFVSTSSDVIDEKKFLTNGKHPDEKDEEFERNFLRAVDRALGVTNNHNYKEDNHLLQPVYDTPMKLDDSDMNLVQITERALSSFKNTNFFTVKTIKKSFW